jgi:hypothetical protein
VLPVGFAFAVVDPSQPSKRIESMLLKLNPVIVLTESHNLKQLQASLPLPLSEKLLRFDRLSKAKQNTQNERNARAIPGEKASVGSLCWVYFTSGSSGEPKGVMVKQFVCWAPSVFVLLRVFCSLAAFFSRIVCGRAYTRTLSYHLGVSWVCGYPLCREGTYSAIQTQCCGAAGNTVYVRSVRDRFAVGALCRRVCRLCGSRASLGWPRLMHLSNKRHAYHVYTLPVAVINLNPNLNPPHTQYFKLSNPFFFFSLPL